MSVCTAQLALPVGANVETARQGRNSHRLPSFPEMAATVSAVRLGALDLAVGNIFGSNAFNMTILLIVDLVYLRAHHPRPASDHCVRPVPEPPI